MQFQNIKSRRKYTKCRKETWKLTKKREYQRLKYEAIERDDSNSSSRVIRQFPWRKVVQSLGPSWRSRIIMNEKGLIEEWKGYFEELLTLKQEESHKAEICTTVNLSVIETSLEETQKALNKLRNYKASSLVQKLTELLKHGRKLNTQLTNSYIAGRKNARKMQSFNSTKLQKNLLNKLCI